MGHGWSFERGGVAGAPEAGRCFVQTLSLSDSELALEEINWTQANTIIVGRNILYIAESALLLSDLTRGPVKAVRSVFTDLVDVLRGILSMRSS